MSCPIHLYDPLIILSSVLIYASVNDINKNYQNTQP